MVLCLSKLSRDAPDLVRAVERAIRITTQDFRVQEGLSARERQTGPVVRGASQTITRGISPATPSI